jgi:serine/threonine-protein kinase
MLYRVLTGEPAFTAPTPIGVLTKHLTDELVPPSQRKPTANIDERVEAIVMRAMQKKPDDRYPTVDAMRAEIESVASELGGLPAALDPNRSAPLPLRRASDRPSSSPSMQARSRPAPNPWAAYEPTAPKDLDDDDSHSDSVNPRKRLRREDLDDFERSLKRRGWLRLILVPVLVIGVGVGALLTVRWWQNRPRSSETEPNNKPDQANRLTRGQPMTGHIAGRIDEQVGDIDFFKVPAAEKDGARTLSVTLSGIPNIDLELDVLDADGTPIARADAAPVGGDEVIPNLRINARAAYIAVHEAQVPGHFPLENTTDAYKLTADWHPTGEAEESEPDDEVSPMTLRVGTPITGYLGAPGDIDAFRLAGGEGKLHIDVTGIEGVDLALRVDGDGWTRRADASGPGGGEHLELDWKQGERAPLIVLWRKDAPGSRAAHPGLATPYHLSVTAP